ncbi:zinc-ribbon domain-containing protein [Falsiroseomonas sp. E2-1-a4]|uniref:zinc-ribbon domain-containing protein n=1 Tax=Falsiroseomonas sp. E2-1-a4 TaxID=3239299 RepID=UPI003F2EFB31
MRISCPKCSAEYDVPDQALAAGPRMLRCARCGHSFRAALPEPPAAEPAPAPRPESQMNARAERPAEPVAPPAPQPPPDPPLPRPAPLRSPLPPGAAAEDRLALAPSSPPDRFAVAGWVLTVLVLGLAAYAGYVFRAEVMEAWPPAQRLYALLGLG